MSEDNFYQPPPPSPAFYQPTIGAPSAPEPDNMPDDTRAIDLLIHERPRILRTKLAVLATEIHERLQIRSRNLETIAEELLGTSNQLLPFEPPFLGVPSPDNRLHQFWLEQQARLHTETRQQSVECWRDVAQLMNDFLTVWEALEQSRVRSEFLRDQTRQDAA